jgi:hypothetical protein
MLLPTRAPWSSGLMGGLPEALVGRGVWSGVGQRQGLHHPRQPLGEVELIMGQTEGREGSCSGTGTAGSPFVGVGMPLGERVPACTSFPHLSG